MRSEGIILPDGTVYVIRLPETATESQISTADGVILQLADELDKYKKALELACKDLSKRTGLSETYLFLMLVREAENK